MLQAVETESVLRVDSNDSIPHKFATASNLLRGALYNSFATREVRFCVAQGGQLQIAAILIFAITVMICCSANRTQFSVSFFAGQVKRLERLHVMYLLGISRGRMVVSACP